MIAHAIGIMYQPFIVSGSNARMFPFEGTMASILVSENLVDSAEPGAHRLPRGRCR
jgi:hypothetical protein